MLPGSKNYFPEFKTIYVNWFKKLLSKIQTNSILFGSKKLLSRIEYKFMLIKKKLVSRIANKLPGTQRTARHKEVGKSYTDIFQKNV
jgi:hypothetical protein